VNDDVHTLSGAYALNATSPEEAARFEDHLGACPTCSQEVRELQAAAAEMAASETAAPPVALKARVLAGAQRTPQLPPTVPASGTAGTRRTEKWFRPLVAVAAAVAVIVAAGIGYNQVTDNGSPSNTLASGVARVFDAPDARHATVETTTGESIHVAASPSLHRMAVDTGDLPDLAAKKVYQLWLVEGDRPTSAGLLNDPDSGAAMELPAEGTKVAITIEPAGGSEQPTDAPIASVLLNSRGRLSSQPSAAAGTFSFQ
jgi:anti-sigma-K factor RskA